MISLMGTFSIHKDFLVISKRSNYIPTYPIRVLAKPGGPYQKTQKIQNNEILESELEKIIPIDLWLNDTLEYYNKIEPTYKLSPELEKIIQLAEKAQIIGEDPQKH